MSSQKNLRQHSVPFVKDEHRGGVCSVALGLGFGIVSVIWLGTVFNDTVIEIVLTFAASYLAFFVVSLCTFL